MLVIGIDPGSVHSARVVCDWQPGAVAMPWGVVPRRGWAGDVLNPDLEGELDVQEHIPCLCIETMFTVYKGAAARDQLVMERWNGRLQGAYLRGNLSGRVLEISSPTAKAAVIGKARGDDSAVRRAIIDAYGGDTAMKGVKCPCCKGRGWAGRGRLGCTDCNETGWELKPNALHGWTGTHVFRALAVVIAAFQPGGAWHTGGE